LLFEVGEPGTTVQKALTLQSVGDAMLNITGAEVTAGSESFTLISPLTELLGAYEPGATVEVLVALYASGRPVGGRITLLSNDATSPTSYVDLVAGPVVPDLVIEPDTIHFGAASVGATKTERVTLRNVGHAPLVVTALTTTDAVFTASASRTVPLELGSQDTVDLTLRFTPEGERAFTGELQVTSNDADGIETVRMHGSAGNRPVAVCDVSPRSVVMPGVVEWRGALSYDPGGYAISSYTWRLVAQPAGSTASMPDEASTSPNVANFMPVVPGRYTAELTVKNALNMESEPCTISVEAAEPPGLWVELVWQHPSDDMDLHLVRADYTTSQSMLSQSPNDCFFVNCVGSFGGDLDWGQPGYDGDDPYMVMDDTAGTGPEVITLARPEDTAYTIWVRDHAGTGSYIGPNMVTVRVHADGEILWEDTRNCDGEGNYFPFAQINWNTGGLTTVDPL
jgi:hypothetical protein